MVKLYYCANCKKIQDNDETCNGCQQTKLKELTKGTPVNVIGTKTKGNVYRIYKEDVHLKVINPDTHEVSIKKYPHDQVRKVL